MGAIAGVILLLLSLLRYKDKWLTIIGVFGIVWTLAFYSTLFYWGSHSTTAQKAFGEISKMQMRRLVKDIEFYKLAHGRYPDKLGQLREDDQLAPIADPAKGLKITGLSYYNYERVGDHYHLFSSGPDGIPGTKDDLYPQFNLTDSSRIGLLPPP